jgi:hypothetical protein
MRGMKLSVCLLLGLVWGCCLYAADDSSPREIPISDITSTSNQNGLQRPEPAHQGDTDNERAGKPSYYLDQISLKGGGAGASNIFLVDAPNFNSAVAATTHVLIGGFSADKSAPLNQPNPPRGNYWLVAYLGISGSNPSEWLVDKATVESTTIRFAYHRANPGAETKDECLYFYWVPLKSLPHGTYQLELFDTEANAVTLWRRVIVDK